MSSNSNWSWQEMITEFRALGGAIENIRLGTGQRGRGLFSIDNTSPILLRLPENLLFPVDGIEFADDRIRLKPTAFVGPAEREFFEKYEENFSWGAGGRTEWMAFEAALDELPAEIRQILTSEFAMAKRLEGDAVTRARKQFLNSRAITWKDRPVVMPLMELANNGEEGLGYLMGDSLRLEGMVADEVVASYGAKDPWTLFFNYGYAGTPIGALSLAMKMNLGAQELAIGSDTDCTTPRGNYLGPELVREGSTLSLSYLMLGHAPYPSVPRGIFHALMKDILGANTDEVFDAVRHFNRSKFLVLLAALERYRGPMIAKLERVARLQLEAISWSIGSADVYAAVPPPWEETEAVRAATVSSAAGWSWDAALGAFRGLGGLADNIRLAFGSFGRGIFPVDHHRPFRLRVPPNLLFPVSDIVFAEGQIGIRPDASVGLQEREFFARYQEAFSWGGGGQSESSAFVEDLDGLPSAARELLSAQFGMGDLFEGSAEERAQKRFLKTTAIQSNGRAFLAPLAELANRRPDGVSYTGDAFREIEGRSGGEIFVSSRSPDAFECFRRFGFASSEPAAFCLPIRRKIGQFELIIRRDIDRQPVQSAITMPQLEHDQGRLVLSFLMLGHPGFPRMSRGIFRAVMRRAHFTIVEADEAFDRILHFNRAKFLDLLKALAPHEGKLVVILRRMARFQLEAMSWCIGVRDV